MGLIPANPEAQNVPSFRRWRFEMKLSPMDYENEVGHGTECFWTGLSRRFIKKQIQMLDSKYFSSFRAPWRRHRRRARRGHGSGPGGGYGL